MTDEGHAKVFTDWVATARLGDPDANGAAPEAVRRALCDEAVMVALTVVYVADRTTLRATLDQLRGAGATAKSIDTLLADIKDRIRSEGGDPAKESQATAIVNAAGAGDAEFFHDAEGLTYATVPIGNHHETYRTSSRAFRLWLRHLYREGEGRSCQAQAVTDAVNELEGAALFDGPEIEVHVRLAEQDGVIYVDLGRPDWSAVEVDAGGWRIVASPPVRFRRPKALLALPEPLAGGKVDDLWVFINVEDEDRPLILGWLVGALRPRGPYFVLNLLGEQGSAKSTAAKVLRRLVDPNTADLRGAVREPRDLMIAAAHGAVIALDNISHLSDWLSDALCRLSTGGGMSGRTLYTDDEETIFEAQRPVILNGIAELATRADLLDRSLLVTLPVIDDEDRRPEEEFWAAFNEAHPYLLGALFSAVAVALANLPTVRPGRLPRMADAAKWAMAAEPALGLEPDAFITAYTLNRDEGTVVALESAPIGPPLLVFLNDREQWTGTASDLLERLTFIADHALTTTKYWPRTPRALSSALRRLAPPLRSLGWQVVFTREAGGNRNRLVTLTKADGEGHPEGRKDRPGPSHRPGEPDPSPPEEQTWDGRDGRDGPCTPPGMDDDDGWSDL